MEKRGTGLPRETATIRRPEIRVEVDRWDWESGRMLDNEPLDITNYVTNYQWQKTIKQPMSGGVLGLYPQYKDQHFVDAIRPRDVVRIYEFGDLKYQAYIRRISTMAMIAEDGKPQRRVQAVLSGFGGIVAEDALGINIKLARENEKYGFIDASTKLKNAISDIVVRDDGGSYVDLIDRIMTAWYDMMDDVGGRTLIIYMDTYLNFETGITKANTPGYPRELELFWGTEQRLTLWDLLQKIVEAPFNEIFFDEGRRDIHNDGTSLRLPEDKTYLIMRKTPYNNTIERGIAKNYFDELSIKELPLRYLTRYDFGRTMDESYSFYMVTPATFDLGEIWRVAKGRYELDEYVFSKYLYRPLNAQLWYTRSGAVNETDQDKNKSKIDPYITDFTETLKNWYEHNDEFLSGVITYLVPALDDIYIGDKLKIEDIDAHFYVEGIAHTWSYGQALVSNATVTRGWGTDDTQVKMDDRIFKNPKKAEVGRA